MLNVEYVYTRGSAPQHVSHRKGHVLMGDKTLCRMGCKSDLDGYVRDGFAIPVLWSLLTAAPFRPSTLVLWLVLVGAYHLPHRWARPTYIAFLWPQVWWTGKGCLVRRDVWRVRRSDTGAGLQEQRELLRCGVIDASPLNLALMLLLGPFYEDVLSYCSNRRRERGLVCALGNNAATMGLRLVVITVHSP